MEIRTLAGGRQRAQLAKVSDSSQVKPGASAKRRSQATLLQGVTRSASSVRTSAPLIERQAVESRAAKRLPDTNATTAAFRGIIEQISNAVSALIAGRGTVGGTQTSTVSAGTSIGGTAIGDALRSVAANQPQLVANANPLPYVTGYVATPRSAGELVQLGGNNFAVPAWQQEVAAATIRNGGFGNAEQGFLAWSKLGFVRLKNENFTAEQNQRLAAISLQLGAEVERLPAAGANGTEVDQFAGQYEANLQAFLRDPTQGLRMKFGKRRFGIELTETGVPQSYSYKKKSGWKSFAEKAVGAAGTALAWTSGAAWIKYGGEAIFGDRFKNNAYVQQVLTQDPQLLTGTLAEQYGAGEKDLRQITASYLDAGATTASLAALAFPQFRPAAAAAVPVLQSASAELQSASN